MAVELDPTVLPVMHKRARPVQRSLLTRVAGGVFMAFAALLCFWLFVLPVVVVALSSVASHWSGTILPDGVSMRWFERLGSSDFDALSTSLEIGFGVAVLGTIVGLWLALALEGRDRRGLGALVDTIAMMPNGVPSVVLGLAVLIAYHKRPLDLSSSAAIVVFVQLALVLPFCYRCAAAALRPELTILREAAASLGAPPAMVLRRVVLPQLVPAIRASLALGFALSLGELGATLDRLSARIRDGADCRGRSGRARLLPAGLRSLADPAACLARCAASDRRTGSAPPGRLTGGLP